MSKDVSEIMFAQASLSVEGRHRRWLLARHPVGRATRDDFQPPCALMDAPPLIGHRAFARCQVIEMAG